MRQSVGLFRKWGKMKENDVKWVKVKWWINCTCFLSCRSGVPCFFEGIRQKNEIKNGWKWKKMSRNEEKWMKMSKNGWKWTEMVFVHFGSFWIIFDHFASFVKRGRPFYLENGHSLKGQTVCGYSKNSSLFTYY